MRGARRAEGTLSLFLMLAKIDLPQSNPSLPEENGAGNPAGTCTGTILDLTRLIWKNNQRDQTLSSGSNTEKLKVDFTFPVCGIRC